MKKVIIGNWKMNKNREEAIALVSDLDNKISDKNVEVVVAPPFIYLEAVKRAAKNISIAAQDTFWEESGAYTGEVSPVQLKDYCSYVLVGHSERRKYQKETNEEIANKVKAVSSVGLIPVLCVGEDLEQRNSGNTEQVLKEKIEEGLSKITNQDLENVIIAYEPIWSISTTENRKDCTVQDAESAAVLIDKIIKTKFGENNARVFFGGNVNPENAEGYLQSNEYAGALVGGASLNAKKFLEIIEKVG